MSEVRVLAGGQFGQENDIAVLWVSVPIEVTRVKAGRKQVCLFFREVNWKLEPSAAQPVVVK